jgi:nitrite reductase (NO-forming)
MPLLIPDLPVTSATPFIRVARTAAIAILVVISLASTPCPSLASTKSFTLTVERKRVSVGGRMTFNAWTYSGTVPGPVLKVVQGDEVKIDLINHTKDAHGIDVYAAQISPQHFDGDPMKSVSYSFPADVPGAFVYHCTATPILDHIASGMYGMMIVEPKGGWPDGNAQEITIVQGELYGLPDARGFIVGSHGKMVEARPDFVVFNGALHRYDFDHPIEIKVGKLVRVFFVNAGPNLTSAFHVTGVLFDTVYKGGNPANAMHGLDTLAVPPSDGAVFEFRVTEPGYYQFMDQNRAQQYKGANGVFRATP